MHRWSVVHLASSCMWMKSITVSWHTTVLVTYCAEDAEGWLWVREILGKGVPIVKYRDFLPSAVQQQLSSSWYRHNRHQPKSGAVFLLVGGARSPPRTMWPGLMSTGQDLTHDQLITRLTGVNDNNLWTAHHLLLHWSCLLFHDHW